MCLRNTYAGTHAHACIHIHIYIQHPTCRYSAGRSVRGGSPRVVVAGHCGVGGLRRGCYALCLHSQAPEVSTCARTVSEIIISLSLSLSLSLSISFSLVSFTCTHTHTRMRPPRLTVLQKVYFLWTCRSIAEWKWMKDIVEDGV